LFIGHPAQPLADFFPIEQPAASEVVHATKITFSTRVQIQGVSTA
jgi:hypothetical protein